MFKPKIAVDRALYDRLRKAAEAAGYSSVDEFILRALEKAVDEADADVTEEQVKKQLQGLGYLE
jgi:hypothetical protein